MGKIHSVLVSIILGIASVGGIFWVTVIFQRHNLEVHKARLQICSDAKKKSTRIICSKGFLTFNVSLNPLKYFEQKRVLKREIFYWKCFNEKYGNEYRNKETEATSRECSLLADKFVKQ